MCFCVFSEFRLPSWISHSIFSFWLGPLLCILSSPCAACALRKHGTLVCEELYLRLVLWIHGTRSDRIWSWRSLFSQSWANHTLLVHHRRSGVIYWCLVDPNAGDGSGRTLINGNRNAPKGEENTVFSPRNQENEKHPPGGENTVLVPYNRASTCSLGVLSLSLVGNLKTQSRRASSRGNTPTAETGGSGPKEGGWCGPEPAGLPGWRHWEGEGGGPAPAPVCQTPTSGMSIKTWSYFQMDHEYFMIFTLFWRPQWISLVFQQVLSQFFTFQLRILHSRSRPRSGSDRGFACGFWLCRQDHFLQIW